MLPDTTLPSGPRKAGVVPARLTAHDPARTAAWVNYPPAASSAHPYRPRTSRAVPTPVPTFSQPAPDRAAPTRLLSRERGRRAPLRDAVACRKRSLCVEAASLIVDPAFVPSADGNPLPTRGVGARCS